ncbi:riboflavin biosynthesis protein RibF [Candidatus Levibacter sp. Uisw_134_01]|uniref:riboflavin biosynthesis protein RibF n=1 Tax=Candidatus Levibacter sp. Uisw_134_01 TaxID=3230999 RepID=UPI003D393EBA
MKIIKWKHGDQPTVIDKKIAIAIGNFDGVHKGHVRLLEAAKVKAHENDLAFGVVTFDPHPRDFFNFNNSSFKLLDRQEKEYQLAKIGVEYLIIIEFSEALKNCTPNEFLSDILYQQLNVVKMFAGANFRFGKNREGTIQNSKEFSQAIGLEIITVDLEQTKSLDGKDKTVISSQSIRGLISNGKLETANTLLGRNWCVTGIVKKGKQQGRELGFPTANLDMGYFLKPPFGVYVTKLKIIDHKTNKTTNDWLPSISNIGKRPTVSGDDINIETHVIDFQNHGVDINLYNKRIKVELLKFLRPEIKFSSLLELKKQIVIDTQKAKKFHSLK